MSQSYRIYMLSRAVSPLTHMSGTAGNEALIMREKVVRGNTAHVVPCLSGNALRYRMVREPGMTWLVERYGLISKLTTRQLNFLFHGGNLTDKGGRDSMHAAIEWRRLWPLVGLLGGALPNQILRSSLKVQSGVLVCRENDHRLPSFIPPDVGLPDGLPQAEQYVAGYQYTRGDVRRSHPHMATRDSSDDGSLMIYGGQVVAPGALFAHGCYLDSVNELEMGALLLSLSLWRERGNTIGGASRIGHGQLHTQIAVDTDIDAAELIAKYVHHIDTHATEAVEWLHSSFGHHELSPEEIDRLKKEAAARQTSFNVKDLDL